MPLPGFYRGRHRLPEACAFPYLSSLCRFMQKQELDDKRGMTMKKAKWLQKLNAPDHCPHCGVEISAKQKRKIPITRFSGYECPLYVLQHPGLVSPFQQALRLFCQAGSHRGRISPDPLCFSILQGKTRERSGSIGNPFPTGPQPAQNHTYRV